VHIRECGQVWILKRNGRLRRFLTGGGAAEKEVERNRTLGKGTQVLTSGKREVFGRKNEAVEREGRIETAVCGASKERRVSKSIGGEK